MADIAPMSEMETRRVYRLQSRNLLVGVWNGSNGFIGIRLKFGDRYLFTEYHYDYSPQIGTVSAAEPLDVWVPDEVPVRETLGTVCEGCGRPVTWVADGPLRGWVYADDPGPACGHPRSVNNAKLFEILDPLDKAETERWRQERRLEESDRWRPRTADEVFRLRFHMAMAQKRMAARRALDAAGKRSDWLRL